MIKEKISLQETVAFLNELLSVDPEGISALFLHRVKCNKNLADHPTVQVGAYEGAGYKLGPLGILNGLFGIDRHGWGHIIMTTDLHRKTITSFSLLTDETVCEMIKCTTHV